MAVYRRVTVEQRVNTMHRVSIGLIAVSLSLISLALGTALFVSPSANFLFVPTSNQVTASASSATAVTLTWTAPGDDGNTGQATSYDIRYATSPVTSDSYAGATQAAGEPLPSPAGTTESFTVSGLQPATTYFFALKATDEAGNVSVMSNVATKSTDALAQACTPTYTCSDWSPCSSGQMTRTCSVTNGCQAGLDAPVTTQACTSAAAPTAVGGEPVHVVNPILVAGLAPGKTPLVHVINPKTKKVTKEFRAFSSLDRNGVLVAAGDVNGDSNADVVVGTGAGSNAVVQVHTPRGVMLYRISPYPTDKGTGVSVAAGDVDGDGVDEIITVPARGLSQVRVWKFNKATSKFSQLAQKIAYDTRSRQGFTVATGDLDLDGRAEIVVAPRANGRSVQIMRLTTGNALQLVKRFSAYPIQFTTGVTVTVGDVFGTGRAMIVTSPGPGYYSDIRVFDITGKLQKNFLLISQSYRKGASLATQDVNGDGRAEIITGTYQSGDANVRVYRYDGVNRRFGLLQSYYGFSRTILTGIRVGGT